MSATLEKTGKRRRTRKSRYPEKVLFQLSKTQKEMLEALSEAWETTASETLRRLIFERYSELDDTGKLRAVVTMEAVDKEGNPVGKKQLVLGLDAEN